MTKRERRLEKLWQDIVSGKIKPKRWHRAMAKLLAPYISPPTFTWWHIPMDELLHRELDQK